MSKWKEKAEELVILLFGGKQEVGGLSRPALVVEGWLNEVEEEIRKELLKKGMGEPPVSEERLKQIRDEHESGWITYGPDYPFPTGQLLEMIDFLQARIAFFVNDNGPWQDGYTAGLREGESKAKIEELKGLMLGLTDIAKKGGWM